MPRIAIDKIKIRKTHRAVNPERVKLIAESIKKNGLRYPISLQRFRKDQVTTIYLVAGRHRLAATKANGERFIDYVLEEGTEADARRWEIAENLHRAELSAAERAQATKDYVKLLADEEAAEALSGAARPKVLPTTRPKKAVPGAVQGRPKGTVAKAADELGLPLRTAKEHIQIADMSDEAKAAAEAAGIDGHKDLLTVARAPKGEQVETVGKLARINTAHAAAKQFDYVANELCDHWSRSRKDKRIEFVRRFKDQIQAVLNEIESAVQS